MNGHFLCVFELVLVKKRTIHLFKDFECTRSIRCCTTLYVEGMAVGIFGGKKKHITALKI